MIEIGAEIPNLDKVRSALNSYPEIAAKRVQEAIVRSIASIHESTIPVTPVRTGRLRASFETRFGLLWGSLYPTVDYAIYVHEGTRRMLARPFLRWGIDKAYGQIERYFETAVGETLDEVARRAK